MIICCKRGRSELFFTLGGEIVTYRREDVKIVYLEYLREFARFCNLPRFWISINFLLRISSYDPFGIICHNHFRTTPCSVSLLFLSFFFDTFSVPQPLRRPARFSFAQFGAVSFRFSSFVFIKTEAFISSICYPRTLLVP